MTSERFFFTHAGYSYDPATETKVQGRWRCARMLANAERKAQENAWTVEWSWDETAGSLDDLNHATDNNPDGWCEASCTRTHEVLEAILKDRRGDVLASLGAIIDPDRNYRRVIEAELALEALETIQDELEEAI